jgi:hypothetical protein
MEIDFWVVNFWRAGLFRDYFPAHGQNYLC